MTRDLTSQAEQHPKDAKTGLTLPLRTSLGLQDLKKHRAMVAFELEVMAKKLDRFGWDRDMGTPTHDRLITDWMDALQDYPLDEVRAACRAFIATSPSKAPHEGTIMALIEAARAAFLREKARLAPPVPDPPAPKPVSREDAAQIMARAGFTPKRIADVQAAPMARTADEAAEIADRPAFTHWTARAAPDGPEMKALAEIRKGNPLMTQGESDDN